MAAVCTLAILKLLIEDNEDKLAQVPREGKENTKSKAKVGKIWEISWDLSRDLSILARHVGQPPVVHSRYMSWCFAPLSFCLAFWC